MLHIVKKEWKEFCYHGKTIVIGCIILCFLFAILHIAAKDSTKNLDQVQVTMGVADNDQSVYSKMLLSYFKNTEVFRDFCTITVGTEQQMEEQFERGELFAYLVIPKGFVENLVSVKNLPIKVVVNNTDATLSLIVKNVLKSYETYISSVEVNCVALYDVMKKDNMSPELLTDVNNQISIHLIMMALNRGSFFDMVEEMELPATKTLEYYSYGILSVVIVFLSMMAAFRFLSECKKGTYERMRLIKRLAFQYYITIDLFYSIGVGVIACLILKFFSYSSSISYHSSCYLFFMGISFFMTSFFMVIGSLFSNVQTYFIVGNIMCILGCIIGGVIIPIMYLPQAILGICKGTANYWIIKTIILSKNQIPVSNGLLAVVFLAGVGLILFGYWVKWSVSCRKGGEKDD